MRTKSILAIAAALLCFTAVSCKKEIDSKGTKYIKVTGISLNTDSMVLIKDDSEQLVAKVTPNNAYNKKVNWSSTNKAAATVDENGVVTGKSTGTTYIKAESDSNPEHYATCEVQVVLTPVPITGLSFAKDEYLVNAGSTTLLSLVYTPSGTTQRKVSWHSSNESIATVNESGVVTGIKNGTVTVTATSQENKTISASVTVKVVEPFTSISIDWPNKNTEGYQAKNGGYYELSPGQTIKVRATTLPATAGDKLTFRSSAPDCVRVSEDGVIEAVKYSSSLVKIYVGCETKNAEEQIIQIQPYNAVTGLQLTISATKTTTAVKDGATRPSEYIGVGATQVYSVSALPNTASQKLNLQSWSSTLNCKFENNTLTVTAKTGISTSTASDKVGAVVRFLAGGVEHTVNFYISEYDPYLPKPGDGLYYATIAGSNRLRNQDSGWRGADIWENSVSASTYNNSVIAMIGHVGSEWYQEDTGTHNFQGAAMWDGVYQAPDEFRHGIAIPVNASYIYASGGGTNHTGGMPFSLNVSDIGAQSDLLKYANDKHTAYSNGVELRAWNDARAGNNWRYQIMPNFYCDYRSTPSSSGSGWYYGLTTSTELNATAPNTFPTRLASYWLMPTRADLFSIFCGRMPGYNEFEQEISSTLHFLVIVTAPALKTETQNRLATFKKAAKKFSGETLDYSHWLWCAQQYDTNNGLAFIAPDSGQAQMKFDAKTNSTGYYVLPILYY
ncbi:MAG: Ig domain-containing protein [Bacteroidales bacterium]|nr:Ig domain-containing protein [Bacteroidales bacterium]